MKLTHVLETIQKLKLTDFIVGFTFPFNRTNEECKQYFMTKVYYEHTCCHPNLSYAMSERAVKKVALHKLQNFSF